MYEELGTVREPVALSPQEALDSAEALLIHQGYKILQRKEDQILAERRKRSGWFGGQAALYLTVAVRPLPEDGVKIKLIGTDRETVQERQAEWSRWAEDLPKIDTEHREAEIANEDEEAINQAEGLATGTSTTPRERKPRGGQGKLDTGERSDAGATQPPSSEDSYTPPKNAVNQDAIGSSHHTCACVSKYPKGLAERLWVCFEVPLLRL